MLIVIRGDNRILFSSFDLTDMIEPKLA